MPELAEVEYMRHRWDAGLGGLVQTVELHGNARIFRHGSAAQLENVLPGNRLIASHRHGKQMAFVFESAWVGLHLGMTGELMVAPANFQPGRHDHLVLRQETRALVFSDPRLFGRVMVDVGPDAPAWWQALPPELLDKRFDRRYLDQILERRRTPIKALLLKQELFPGVGNWMADEILWRAEIHPVTRADRLTDEERGRLLTETKAVARGALKSIAGNGDHWGDPPGGWLFHQRWETGGRCPKTGAILVRETIGGRTTCWSPGCQIPPSGA